jgi:hypothetical protein
MKKIVKYLVISLFASLTACSDSVLDIEQQGVIPVATYQNATDSEVNSFIAAVYSKVHGDGYYDMMTQTSASATSVRGHLGRMSGDFADYYQYTETATSSTYSKIWSYYYTIIYWCNMMIENLPGNKVASADLVTHVIAEARAIRAISMMYLVQLYGNPPLADHILTGSEGNTPAAESWAFIETELKEIAESRALPSKSGRDGQKAIGGRLTTEAVYAYLSKAYLWEKKYDEAANTLYSKVISTNLYELEDDFTELNRYTSDFCPEYLWECDITHEPSDYALSQAGMFDAIIYNWSSGSLNIPDEIYNGMGFGNATYASESFGSFMEKHDALPGGDKTPRYRGTVATYEDLLDENLYTYSGGSKGILSAQIDNCEGYFRVKLTPRVENVMGGSMGWMYSYMHNNLCYMRYAEVLLNYAEAVAMGGAPGAMSGLEALNLVRRRAGLGDAPALDMNHEDYGVKAERRAELYFENSRFIDLVRWGDAPVVLADCGKQSVQFLGYKDGNNSTVQSKDSWYIVRTQTVGNGFKANKNELFPIPSVDVSSSPNLQQNPGW